MCKASLDATICSRLYIAPLNECVKHLVITTMDLVKSKLEHTLTAYVATPFYTVLSSPTSGLSHWSIIMKDLFFVINPESNGSGRAAICRDPLNVAGSTIWSHTITNHDRRNGSPSVTKVCEIAFNALRKGKTPAQASEEAGV